MAEVKESGILIQDVETKNIMTKSTLPVGGYSVNPYVGCRSGFYTKQQIYVETRK